ncbi:SAGA-associated factor 11 [Abortiporus biennis]
MPKREREDAISELSSRIFSTMLEEVLLDVVLQSHHEIARSKVVCPICHTKCNEVHVPSVSLPGPSSSHSTPPNGVDSVENGRSDTGTSTPVNGKDGNVYFECEVCKQQVASNRFARHLSACLGLGNSRRNAARTSTAKSKLASEAGRSASPYVPSESGHVSDEGKANPKKSKSKAKKADEAEFSLHRKRNGSPSVSPTKKSKKQKTTASAVTRVKSEPDILGAPNNSLPPSQSNSQSRIPSKLRETSLASFIPDQRSSSPDSQDSSSTPTSTLSARSPVIPAALPPKKKAPGKTKAAANGLAKRPSPPRPPPPPVIRMPSPDFLGGEMDGDETGSSTDTDSD